MKSQLTGSRSSSRSSRSGSRSSVRPGSAGHGALHGKRSTSSGVPGSSRQRIRSHAKHAKQLRRHDPQQQQLAPGGALSAAAAACLQLAACCLRSMLALVTSLLAAAWCCLAGSQGSLLLPPAGASSNGSSWLGRVWAPVLVNVVGGYSISALEGMDGEGSPTQTLLTSIIKVGGAGAATGCAGWATREVQGAAAAPLLWHAWLQVGFMVQACEGP